VLSLDEVERRSTFTVTNLGMYDIDSFTPHHQPAGVRHPGRGPHDRESGRHREETEATAVRRMMALSLTFDHRVVDGAPAARFLKTHPAARSRNPTTGCSSLQAATPPSHPAGRLSQA